MPGNAKTANSQFPASARMVKRPGWESIYQGRNCALQWIPRPPLIAATRNNAPGVCPVLKCLSTQPRSQWLLEQGILSIHVCTWYRLGLQYYYALKRPVKSLQVGCILICDPAPDLCLLIFLSPKKLAACYAGQTQSDQILSCTVHYVHMQELKIAGL